MLIKCPTSWREYILAQLENIVNCDDAINQQLDVAFLVYAPLACGDEFLQALYAKRHLLGYLIAVYASRVDYYQSFTTDVGRYKREAEGFSNDFSVLTAQSSRRADTTAISREDSFSNTDMELTSQDYNYARNRSEQRTTADDTGYGENRAQARSRGVEDSSSQEDGTSRSDSTGYATNWDTACSLFSGYDSTRTQAQLFYSETRSTSGNSEFLRSRGTQFRQDVDSSRNRTLFTARSSDTTEDTSESYSYFNEVADTIATSGSSTNSVGRGFTDSTTRQRDRGNGFGIAESRSTTQNSSSSFGRGESQSQMDSEGRGYSKHDVTAQDLSDIAKHLTMLYDLNEQDIQHYIAARNKMLFIGGYLERYAEMPRCFRYPYAPVVLKHDRLATKVCV